MTGRWYFQQIVLTSSAIGSQVSLIMVQTRYWLPERASDISLALQAEIKFQLEIL
jgi:hypothetical protein